MVVREAEHAGLVPWDMYREGANGERTMTVKRKVLGEVTEKVEPLAVAIEALVSAMMVYEKVGAEYRGLEPARKQLRQALSGAIHGL
jgi:hypothetical protein